MAVGLITEDILTGIADNIRTAVNETFNSGADSLDQDVQGLITDRTTVSSYKNDRVPYIRPYAFYNCTNLVSVDLGEAVAIGSYAFGECENLTTVYLPLVETIYMQAFRDCALTAISLPSVKYIAIDTGNDGIFNGCTKLTEIHFAKANEETITALGGYSSKFGATNATIYFDL